MMKKIMLLVVALLLLATPVLAETAALVVDEAGLLTQEEQVQLERSTQEISERYGMDVVVYTVRDIGEQNIKIYAADLYNAEGYGRGETNDGIMLLLSDADRDFAMVTTGAAISAFTDLTLEMIEAEFIPFLSQNQYAAAFQRFLDAVGSCLEAYEPPVVRSALERTTDKLPFIALGALAIMAIGMLILKGQMRTAVPKRGAADYVRPESLQMARSDDIFLYRTVVRVPRPKPSSSSTGGSGSSSGGGGSSTFKSSSGTTHGGRSGKY